MFDTSWTKKNKVLITCPKGLATYLAAELAALGYPIVSELEAAVETEATLEGTLDLNLHLRTGHRVLFLLAESRITTPGQLYASFMAIPWENWISNDGYLCVTSTVDTPAINDARFVNVKAKDAIVDRLRDRTGHRPDSGPDRTGTVVHVYWKADLVRIFLDTSGEPLSRRGYRKIPLEAPMQETLAASVVLATGWQGSEPFVNPMCGSGTLAIEAALIALNRAPGLLRQNFGFMHLKGYDPSSWQTLQNRARENEKKAAAPKLIATDISAAAIRASRQNAQAAAVDHLIDFGQCPFEKTVAPEGSGVVVLNPGYGKRMGAEQELAETYHGIGDFFKNTCKGYRGYIFTGNLDLAKKVGLRTSRRILFYNSEIECRLLEYEIYSGSRKHPDTTQE